jgi:hypothetical protein
MAYIYIYATSFWPLLNEIGWLTELPVATSFDRMPEVADTSDKPFKSREVDVFACPSQKFDLYFGSDAR